MSPAYKKLKPNIGTKAKNKRYLYERGNLEEEEDGQLYTFASGDYDSTQDEINTCSVKLGRPKSAYDLNELEELVERHVEPGETLQSIALQYRLPISELKRVNNFHHEKEIFAHRSIKIPVRENSALKEMLVEYGEASARSTEWRRTHFLSNGNISSTDLSESESESVRTLSIGSVCRLAKTNSQANRFFRNMDKDLMHIREKTNTFKSSLEEVTSTLMEPRFYPFPESRKSWWAFMWDDCCRCWWKVIVVAVIVLVCPILYMLVTPHDDSVHNSAVNLTTTTTKPVIVDTTPHV